MPQQNPKPALTITQQITLLRSCEPELLSDAEPN